MSHNRKEFNVSLEPNVGVILIELRVKAQKLPTGELHFAEVSPMLKQCDDILFSLEKYDDKSFLLSRLSPFRHKISQLEKIDLEIFLNLLKEFYDDFQRSSDLTKHELKRQKMEYHRLNEEAFAFKKSFWQQQKLEYSEIAERAQIQRAFLYQRAALHDEELQSFVPLQRELTPHGLCMGVEMEFRNSALVLSEQTLKHTLQTVFQWFEKHFLFVNTIYYQYRLKPFLLKLSPFFLKKEPSASTFEKLVGDELISVSDVGKKYRIIKSDPTNLGATAEGQRFYLLTATSRLRVGLEEIFCLWNYYHVMRTTKDFQTWFDSFQKSLAEYKHKTLAFQISPPFTLYGKNLGRPLNSKSHDDLLVIDHHNKVSTGQYWHTSKRYVCVCEAVLSHEMRSKEDWGESLRSNLQNFVNFNTEPRSKVFGGPGYFGNNQDAQLSLYPDIFVANVANQPSVLPHVTVSVNTDQEVTWILNVLSNLLPGRRSRNVRPFFSVEHEQMIAAICEPFPRSSVMAKELFFHRIFYLWMCVSSLPRSWKGDMPLLPKNINPEDYIDMIKFVCDDLETTDANFVQKMNAALSFYTQKKLNTNFQLRLSEVDALVTAGSIFPSAPGSMLSPKTASHYPAVSSRAFRMPQAQMILEIRGDYMQNAAGISNIMSLFLGR